MAVSNSSDVFSMFLLYSDKNVGKYGPEKLRIRRLFTQWLSFMTLDMDLVVMSDKKGML